ncbi:dTDP-4-dehydrorhamnose reductase [Candidatus Methanoperedens nitroreducens]|uniref:dTDP-4-dehydrorhamnose reductase n=1 Tax=Candidatus Methanoperedens nitratireducens TaxID=1392998 RepID=A0A062V493_9EURY|nr:SDR family oxidoreductase [Candidatus Methanoperedens nitroreducens]KCZ72167.1 dTDP-4-dehydrorhamnose reductase [Candidatus Methanoperedens nitroreducens]MDJ1421855.1 SDR family oxidoreductase [Candidatus Methanoperedens sp.]
MNLLILGAYGMLGHKLFQKLSQHFDTYATCRNIRKEEWISQILPTDRLIPSVQAEDFDSILKAINAVRPDAIINCIGIIKQLDAAKDPIPSIAINALFPHQLAAVCQAQGIRLIHFSTDCVFSGKNGMYTHKDIADAEDLYGRTKFLGEVGGKGCITIRSSIIGRELGTRHGLLEWFLSQAGGTVKGYRKAIYTGFTTIEMSHIVNKILVNHPDLSGVWHVASSPISKYDLLCHINEKMVLNVRIEPDDQFICDRSLDGRLFAKQTGYVAPSWDKMIEELAKDSSPYNDIKKADVKN